MFDAYECKDEDGELVGFSCEFCADPAEEKLYHGDCGESDSPQNCDGCGRLLTGSLTSHGVHYVLEAAADELGSIAANGCIPSRNLTYYEGSPHCSIVADWLDSIDGYGFTGDYSLSFGEIRTWLRFNRHRASHGKE